MKRKPGRFVLSVTIALILTTGIVHAATSALDLDIKPDGETDGTRRLQEALDAGKTDVHFPKGSYLLGAVRVPADSRLSFAPGAEVRVNRGKLAEVEYTYYGKKRSARSLFELTGDNITIDGLDIDCTYGKVHGMVMIYGRRVSGLTFRNITAINPIEGEMSLSDLKGKKFRHRTKGQPAVIRLFQCQNIEVSGCRGFNLSHMVETFHCEDVSVHGNRLEVGNTITTFNAGSRGLRHYDNWSRKVTYQCVFRGGSPDPCRKPDRVPLGSSTTVERNVGVAEEGYNRHTAGTYDIQITNNYAEYGRTLAWGNKARQVIFEGNVSRFMNDYSYGTEGCENVTFANNVSINAHSAGIMTMYWASKVIITGNIIIVRDEPYVQAYSDYDSQKGYWGWSGGLIRLHHGGPTTEEDTKAGSRYGPGKVMMTNNLCINALTDKVRQVRIEMARDIMFSGNKVINGQFFGYGPKGDLNITGNEFISRMPQEHYGILAGGITDRVNVSDNVFRRVPPEGQEPAEQQPAPAVLMPDLEPGALRVVEGNTIEGWNRSILVRAGVNPNEELVDFDSYEVGQDTELVRPDEGQPPGRIIIRNNEQDGSIGIEGFEGTYRSHLADNIDLESLEPADARVRPME